MSTASEKRRTRSIGAGGSAAGDSPPPLSGTSRVRLRVRMGYLPLSKVIGRKRVPHEVGRLSQGRASAALLQKAPSIEPGPHIRPQPLEIGPDCVEKPQASLR